MAHINIEQHPALEIQERLKKDKNKKVKKPPMESYFYKKVQKPKK